MSGRTDLGAREVYEAMTAAAGDAEAGAYSEYVRFEVGHWAYFSGDVDTADRYFASVAESSTVIGAGARHGLAGAALRRSEFGRVVELLRDGGGSPVEQIRTTNMLGHVQLHNGQFNRAAELFTSVLERARQVNAPLRAARGARHLALSCMWLDPDRTLRVVPEARELNQALGERVGLAQCDLAAAVAQALLGRPDRAGKLFADAKQGLAAIGVDFDLLPVRAVEVFLALVQDRPGEAMAGAREMCELTASGRPAGPPSWSAVAALWVGQPSWQPFTSVAWLEPEDARNRWLEPVSVSRRAGNPAAGGDPGGPAGT